MDYKKFGNAYMVRINRGEELVEKLMEFAKAEEIKLATVSGIGAADDVTIGVYSVEEQKYYQNTYQEELEMTSLAGNFSTMNGEEHVHLHANFGRFDGSVVGGHLNKALISGTSELVVQLLDGEVDRYKDDVTGLNLLDFS